MFRFLPLVPDNLMSIAEGFQPKYGSYSAHEGTDLTEGATTLAPTPVVLAAKFPEDVVLPTMTGAAPLDDFAEVVSADVLPWRCPGQCLDTAHSGCD